MKPVTLAIFLLVAGCGGSTSTRTAPKQSVDAAALYRGCGLRTLGDMPSDLRRNYRELNEEQRARLKEFDREMQRPPTDTGACLAFVREIVRRDDYRETVSGDDMLRALDAGRTLCKEAIGRGEACYLLALSTQIASWKDGGGTPSERHIQRKMDWLNQACQQGHTPSCNVLDTGTDDRKRTWDLAPARKPSSGARAASPAARS